jgi:Na+/H+ antiporter NhaB
MSEEITQSSNDKEKVEKKKKFFQLKDKYIVAFILGLVTTLVATLINLAILPLIGLALAIIYTIYREVIDNDKISKKIIGILIGLLLTPVFFRLAQKLIVILFANN